MFNNLHGQTFHFNGSVLAFEALNEFVLESVGEDSPFAVLQSQEDANIGFVVASPFTFFKDFAFELDEHDKEELGLTEQHDALILGFITLQDPFQQSTMNLVAPLVINISNSKGKQIVLPPKYEYSTKTPLFHHGLDKGGTE